MKAKKSVLQLKSVNIEHLKIEWNLSTVKEINPEDYIVDLDFDAFKVKDKKDTYLLKLSLKVNHSKKVNFAFKVSLSLSGIFTFLEPVDEERKTQYLLHNGLSILYGFARGYLFSKLDPFHPDHRILPTINLLDIIRRKLKNKKLDNKKGG